MASPKTSHPEASNGAARRLAVAGDLLEDIIVWGTHLLEHATDNPASIVRSRGGSGANVAVAAASMVPVVFIGRVGADGIGSYLEAELTKAGVTPFLQHEGRTGTVIVLVDRDGERTMIPDRASAAELGTVDPACLDGVAWLHIPIYGFETAAATDALLELVREARVRQIPVSLDTSSVSILRELGEEKFFWLVDQISPRVVFANGDESDFVNLPLHPPGPNSTWVIKHGPRPVEVIEDGRSTSFPVEAVEKVLDSTGAGDAFAAGFLAAAIGGGDMGASVGAGARLAAGVLRLPGALGTRA